MTSAVTSRALISGICQRAARAALALAVVLAPAVVATRSARAQTFSVLFRFPAIGTDGANPNAGLVRDASGNLYGTTSIGGANGLGTVFELDATGKETVLHSFVGHPTDGFGPLADLIRDASGNLYGTTFEGGAGLCGGRGLPAVGCGTVFKLNTTGNEAVLYSFGLGFRGVNPAKGIIPYAGLVRDAAGNLYGTTGGGGASGDGAVFKLDATNNETVLHSFTGADGRSPLAGLVRDASGNLYGTTASGGAHGLGTVFKLDATGKETVLHSFSGSDGEDPAALLIRDASGNLYGTTYAGGNECSLPNSYGSCGTVFKLR